MLKMFLVCLLLPGIAVAATVGKPSLSEVVSGSDAIAVVEVLEGRVHEFEYGGIAYSCGARFRASIREPVKGLSDQDELSFHTRVPLAVGSRYLLFLSENENLEPILEDLRFPLLAAYQSEAFDDCLSGLETSWNAGIGIRFSEVFVGETEQWLVTGEHSYLRFPSKVKMMKIECSAEEPEACDRIGEPVLIVWSSLLSLLHSEK